MLTVAAPGRRDAPGPKETEIAFLLAQLGAFAAGQFGERAAVVGFTPPEAGLLRLISRAPGQSQQQIAAQLGARPSRLVALVDGLEQRGLVERRRNTEDRRNYALHLTDAGRDPAPAPAPEPAPAPARTGPGPWDNPGTVVLTERRGARLAWPGPGHPVDLPGARERGGRR